MHLRMLLLASLVVSTSLACDSGGDADETEDVQPKKKKKKAKKTKEEKPKDEKPDPNKITEFLKEFETDADAALASYANKTVKLSGQVRYTLDLNGEGDHIGVNSDGANKQLPYVVCHSMKDRSSTELPSEGTPIVIEGRPLKVHPKDAIVPMRVALEKCTATFAGSS